MQSLLPHELQQWILEKKDFQLIDVREPLEHEAYNIGGSLIPFGQIQDSDEWIDTGKPVVLYCEKGIRSMIAIQRLQIKFPSISFYNLSGGMSAWRKELDVNTKG